MNEKKTCASCAFCKEEGHGYSEYTITDSTYDCMGSMNPGFPLNDYDSTQEKQAAILEFAETCPAFLAGTRLSGGLFVDDDKKEFSDWTKQFGPQSNGDVK